MNVFFDEIKFEKETEQPGYVVCYIDYNIIIISIFGNILLVNYYLVLYYAHIFSVV